MEEKTIIYAVKDRYTGHLYGLYTTMEKAEKAKATANYNNAMGGGPGAYFIKEYEVE